MLHNRILRETTHESAEFVSPICIVKKLDGRVRLILNLKELHEFFKYEHFTMVGIKTIINKYSFKKLFHDHNRFERCLPIGYL